MSELGTHIWNLGTVITAFASWLGAMLLGGLVTAYFRTSGLHRNSLLEEARLGPALRDYLKEPRRFQITTGTLYITLTVMGCYSWGVLLSNSMPTVSGVKFYTIYTLTGVAGWSLGGLLFKMIAASMAVPYARVVGTVMYPLSWLLRPWSTLMLLVMDKSDDTLWTSDGLSQLSTGEIRSLINEDGQDVTLDDDEREMIQSIFNFHDTAVREIMIPRIDVVALDGDSVVIEMVEEVIASGHSRIPIYKGSVDKVIGILYSKDLLKLVEKGRFLGGNQKLEDMVRPAYYIPESKKIDEVLDEFRSKRIHMAVVIDEYGGTAGLVTLEDVIEEIVGEIEDEFDLEEQLLSWIDEQSVRLDPKIDLEDLEEQLGIDLKKAEGADTCETLGGLIYEAAGNVPVKGDQIEVADYSITVEDVEDQRILRVLLRSEEPFPGFAKRDEN